MLATKADVREELDRLTAHIAAARDAAGRRRRRSAAGSISSPRNSAARSNTLCSKSNDSALTRIGLELKAVVDQFREQVQNLE